MRREEEYVRVRVRGRVNVQCGVGGRKVTVFAL
jgi:hypothetical protein